MLTLVDHLKHTTQFRWNRLHKFRAKIDLYIEVGPYIIQTANSTQQLLECFKLRHAVFNQEFRGITGPGFDFDRFDYHFDHLIIIHKESQQLVGTYRLSCSTHSSESYTALEFDLQNLKKLEGPFLELGRACIHKDFRKGATISLLWRGIAEYMNLCGANILYGCSSLKINHARESALIYKRLTELDKVDLNVMCSPTKKFQMKDFDAWYSYFGLGLDETQTQEADSLIPSLLKSYLKVGAKIIAEPAFDEDFDCIDVLTILKKDELSNSLANKFKVSR